MSLFSSLFNFVLLTIGKYNIDESHGLSHAIDILVYTNRIFEEEVIAKPQLKKYERTIYISAILHDMCDKKYMDENEGLVNIQTFLGDQIPEKEIDDICKIISTMSYSKVKKYGYPDLGELQASYHIVREADLLCAYDFDRSLMFHMHKKGCNMEEVFNNALDIFYFRVFKHEEDNLFLSDFSKRESRILHEQSLQRIQHWRTLVGKKL